MPNENIYGSLGAGIGDSLFLADAPAKLLAPQVLYGPASASAAVLAAAAEPYAQDRLILGFTNSGAESAILWPFDYALGARFTFEAGFRMRDGAYTSLQIGAFVYSPLLGLIYGVALTSPLSGGASPAMVSYIDNSVLVATANSFDSAGLGLAWRGEFDFEFKNPVVAAPAYYLDARFAGVGAAAQRSSFRFTRIGADDGFSPGVGWAGRTLNRVGVYVIAQSDGSPTAREVDVYDARIVRHPKDR